MDWQVTVWFKVVQDVGMMKKDFYARLWKPLCTLSALQWTSITATVTSCLTTSMLCVSLCQKLSRSITKQTLGDCTFKDPQEMQTSFKNGQQEQKKNKTDFIALGHRRSVGVTGFCFHSASMQDCPRLTTYAIYSHSLFIQTASWLLAFKSLLH